MSQSRGLSQPALCRTCREHCLEIDGKAAVRSSGIAQGRSLLDASIDTSPISASAMMMLAAKFRFKTNPCRSGATHDNHTFPKRERDCAHHRLVCRQFKAKQDACLLQHEYLCWCLQAEASWSGKKWRALRLNLRAQVFYDSVELDNAALSDHTLFYCMVSSRNMNNAAMSAAPPKDPKFRDIFQAYTGGLAAHILHLKSTTFLLWL